MARQANSDGPDRSGWSASMTSGRAEEDSQKAVSTVGEAAFDAILTAIGRGKTLRVPLDGRVLPFSIRCDRYLRSGLGQVLARAWEAR